LAFNVLEFNGNLEASLVEVAGGFVVLELFVELTDGEVSFERFLGIALAPVLLSVN
jgi:hypothetical protein